MGSMTSRTPRIVVADDEPMLRQLLALVLTPHGYEVVGCRDGEEALERTRELDPDLVILDLQMPTMAGDEAARALRADPATAALPLICLSGEIARLDSPELTTLFTRCLGKPFDAPELVAAIAELLAASTSERSAR